MYKPWICYRVRSYFIFFLFLILEILQKSEVLPWFEMGRWEGSREGVTACLYVYFRAFFNGKAVHFWEVLIFFVSFFLQAFLQ